MRNKKGQGLNLERRKEWLKEYRAKPKVKERIKFLRDENLKNPETKVKIRKRRLVNRYGITLENYDSLLEKQNYSCAICKEHKDKFNKELSVDHDHITGEIRGLLCSQCNHGLGLFKDNIDSLIQASDYLKINKHVVIEEKIRILHPDNDGSYVEFNNLTLRQMDILKEYEKLIKKNEVNKQNKTDIKSKTRVS